MAGVPVSFVQVDMDTCMALVGTQVGTVGMGTMVMDMDTGAVGIQVVVAAQS